MVSRPIAATVVLVHMKKSSQCTNTLTVFDLRQYTWF